VRIEALQFLKTFGPILIREPGFSVLPFAIEGHFLLVGTQQSTQKPHVWGSVNFDEVIPKIEDRIPDRVVSPAVGGIGTTRFELKEIPLHNDLASRLPTFV
jgi:hypothetical protein